MNMKLFPAHLQPRKAIAAEKIKKLTETLKVMDGELDKAEDDCDKLGVPLNALLQELKKSDISPAEKTETEKRLLALDVEMKNAFHKLLDISHKAQQIAREKAVLEGTAEPLPIKPEPTAEEKAKADCRMGCFEG